MRIKYIEKRFGDAHMGVIDQANAICASYKAQGYDLTLRQLYYQFVSRDLIANKQTEYKRLGGIINDARLAGLLDWDYIVDRTRELDGPGTRHSPHWRDPAQIIDAVARSYKINKWADQEYYVEVWIEKDALKGVLESCCPDLDVAFFSCRGYTSQSEIWGAAQRLGAKVNAGKRCVVVHLGDHDPSGVDMTRDVHERLAMFMAQDLGLLDTYDTRYNTMADFAFEMTEHGHLAIDRIALNMDQIRAYDPPPNPAKFTDARAAGYVEKYGYESWELDALEPSVLADLVRDAVGGYRDDDRWDEMVERETDERVVLDAVSERWDEVEELLS